MARKPVTQKAPSVHAQIIEAVLADYPTAKTSGFMRTLQTLPGAEYMQSMWQHEREWWASVTFIPDAFLIDSEERHVVVFEAVHTHDVPVDKFGKMTEMSWALDQDCYEMILVRCDRFGRIAYHVQMVSVANAFDLIQSGKKPKLHKVEDWQRYTLKVCADRFGLAA